MKVLIILLKYLIITIELSLNRKTFLRNKSKRKKIMGLEELKRLRDKKAKPRSPTRVLRMGGGLMEATQRLKRQGLLRGGVARGCGRILKDRKKVTKVF